MSARAIAIAAVFLAGCAATVPTADLSSTPYVVTVKDFEYVPQSLTVPVGSTVAFKFVGPTPHSVTFDDNSWDSGFQSPGAVVGRMFPTAGTFGFHCSAHAQMTGTILVQ